jgi:hypothetical protein
MYPRAGWHWFISVQTKTSYPMSYILKELESTSEYLYIIWFSFIFLASNLSCQIKLCWICRYDSSKLFTQNVELTDPIISRFDVLCVVKVMFKSIDSSINS